MRHNEKKGIFFIASAGLMAGLAFGFAEASKEEVRPILTNTIRYANDNTETGNDGTSSSPDQSQLVVDKDGKVYVEYRDDNGNGIPDELEELVGTKKIDNVMTITLTSAMNACLNIITFIYGLYKWKHLSKTVDCANANSATNVANIASANAKQVLEIASQATESVQRFKADAQTISDSVKRQQEVVDTLQTKIEESNRNEVDQTKAIEALKESNEALTKGYSSVSARLDAILANQALTADSADNVRNGVATQIHENVKGAVNYGKSKDSLA